MANDPIHLTVFNDHLTQIEEGIAFFALALSAKKHIPAVVNWNAERYAVQEIRNFLKAQVISEVLFCNNNYLSSVSAFEEFLRKTIEFAIGKYVRTLTNFDELSSQLQNTHMKATGRLLARCTNPPQQLAKINYFDVCRRLGTCIPGKENFEINIEALGIVDDLLSLDNFIDRLAEFNYQISLDSLGSKSELSTALRTRGTRETSKALSEYLKNMVKDRNRIAHTGASASAITSAILLDHIKVLRSLAGSIVSLL